MYIRRLQYLKHLINGSSTRATCLIDLTLRNRPVPVEVASLKCDRRPLCLASSVEGILSLRSTAYRSLQMTKYMHSGTEMTFGSTENFISEWKERLRMSTYRGTAVFVLGAMGSGKSTVIESEFKNHLEYGNYAYVDTDEFMELLEGFTPDKVEQYYPIAREISIYLTDWLLNENISFVAEGTCVKFLELEDYMERLRYTGYTIKVRKIDNPPLETVLQRSRCRRNRKLPDDLVRSIYYGSRHGIEQLFKLNKNYALFDEI